MKNLLFLLFTLSLLSACQKDSILDDQTFEEKFFLENEEAIMPVVVSGNISSNTFCIILHGGPGDSAIQSFYSTNSFDEMEEEMAVVYFDQRCSGLSQGNGNAEELKIEHFVNDVDKLIELLKYKYGQESSFFLLGHSWGGTLGVDYLLNGKYASELKGCVISNGSHSIPLATQEEYKSIMQIGAEQINLGHSVDDWNEIINNIKDLDLAEFYDRIALVEESYKTLMPFLKDDVVNSVSLELENRLRETANSFLVSSSIQNNNNPNFYKRLMEYDVTHRLSEISTPVALYWGKYDMAIPASIATELMEEIGSKEKELYLFERSHHAPMMHENELYQEKVIEFITTFR